VSADAEEGLAEVNGTRLHYAASGAGPAILFIHAFTLDRRMWSRQVAALARRFRVVTYDCRGHGLSAPPGSDPYFHGDDAAALCAHLGITRVVAVGLSLGAHQALELALDRPDLVAGLGSIAMSALASVPFPDDIVGMIADVRRAARDQGIGAARDIWRRCGWFAPARETPPLAAELDSMIDGYSGWHWTHDNPVRNIEPPAAERLGELRVPTLVVTGTRDLPYNAEIGRRLRAGIPGATSLEVPGAGHMVNMESPTPVTDAIAELVERSVMRGGS
jgi:pimeloyl-ACP methyl ester carboxylesterase